MSPANQNVDLLPWRRAESMTRCSLYWIPATFPLRETPRQWLRAFLDRFEKRMQEQSGLRAETFLHAKTLARDDVRTAFMRSARQFSPIIGLSLRPGADLPPLPTEDDIAQFREGRKKYDPSDFVGDYCYWFIDKSSARQREAFLGYGGLANLYMKQDSRAEKAPSIPKGFLKHPVASKFDVQGMLKRAHSLQDGFLELSKELFGRRLREEPQYSGLLFVIPLLASRDFFLQPDAECEKWFQLFDACVYESLEDKGLLLASKNDLDQELAAIVNEMKSAGLPYPEN